MKKILSDLDIITILLIVTVITACFQKESFHIALISISILGYNLVNKYLGIINKKVDDNNIITEINKKIIDTNSRVEEMNEKVKHLTSKDTVKDLMSGIANNKR